MRNRFLTALVLMAFSAASALAQQVREQKQSKPAPSLPLRPKAAANACTEYGPGFVRIEGSSTCIKIGGGVSVGAGVAR